MLKFLATLIAVRMLLKTSAAAIVYRADLRGNILLFCELYAILLPAVYSMALTVVAVAVDLRIIQISESIKMRHCLCLLLFLFHIVGCSVTQV